VEMGASAHPMRGGRRADRVRRFQAMMAAVGAYAAQHPVFRLEDLDVALRVDDRHGRLRRSRVVRRLVRRGALVRLARSVYAGVGEGRAGAGVRAWGPGEALNVYAAVAMLSRDSVLAYRSALEIYGLLPRRSTCDVIVVSHSGWRRAVRWGGVHTHTVKPPTGLARSGRCELGVRSVRRGETDVRVTGPERTFVDAFDRPRLVGSEREILTALAELVRRHPFDWRLLVAYVRRLGRGTTAARVGWWLERGHGWNGVPAEVLVVLERLRPTGPAYWSWRDRERCAQVEGRFATRWNLMVPGTVVALAREINHRMRVG
jgi:predicted transcriptional regulator of viral defense system